MYNLSVRVQDVRHATDVNDRKGLRLSFERATTIVHHFLHPFRLFPVIHTRTGLVDDLVPCGPLRRGLDVHRRPTGARLWRLVEDVVDAGYQSTFVMLVRQIFGEPRNNEAKSVQQTEQ